MPNKSKKHNINHTGPKKVKVYYADGHIATVNTVKVGAKWSTTSAVQFQHDGHEIEHYDIICSHEHAIMSFSGPVACPCPGCDAKSGVLNIDCP